MRQLIFFLTLLTLLTLFVVGDTVFAEEFDFVKFEDQMLGYAREKDWDILEARLAPGYHSTYQNSAIGLKASLEAWTSINLGDVRLSNFKVTRSGSAVVLSYEAQLGEKIDNKRVPRRLASSVGGWVRTVKGWLTLLHPQSLGNSVNGLSASLPRLTGGKCMRR